MRSAVWLGRRSVASPPRTGRVPSPAAERQSRCRARRRRGETPLQISVHDDFILALLESGSLTEAEALNKLKLQQAAGEVLQEWAARWLR